MPRAAVILLLAVSLARAEAAALKQDLARQTDRAARLQKALDDLRRVVQRDQQRKRLEHQSPDTVK